jgi:low temperature requirement protein LtrA
MGRGWRVAPEHFAERYGLIVLIALGESIIALSAGFKLVTGVIAAAALGIVVVSALWWLYFDVAAILARRRATGRVFRRRTVGAVVLLTLVPAALAVPALAALALVSGACC